jgi:hypothetical protein
MEHWARSMLASEPINKNGAWGFVQHDRLTRRGGVKGSDLVFIVSDQELRRFGSPNSLGLCEDVDGTGRRRGGFADAWVAAPLAVDIWDLPVYADSQAASTAK